MVMLTFWRALNVCAGVNRRWVVSRGNTANPKTTKTYTYTDTYTDMFPEESLNLFGEALLQFSIRSICAELDSETPGARSDHNPNTTNVLKSMFVCVPPVVSKFPRATANLAH